MSAETPRPERVTLTDVEREEVWQGLQRIRPADPDAPPVALIRPDDMDHALWAVAPAVERILAAREQALREEIASEIEAEAHPFRALSDPDGHRATLHAARIARGGAR